VLPGLVRAGSPAGRFARPFVPLTYVEVRPPPVWRSISSFSCLAGSFAGLRQTSADANDAWQPWARRLSCGRLVALMTAASDWQSLKAHVAEAFEALRKDGVNARGPVGFDQREALEKVVKPEKYRAYAFFHSQDSATARRGGPLWIGFGCTAERATGPQAVAVGREVTQALERHGLYVEWDGGAKKRVATYLSAKSAQDAREREAKQSAAQAAATKKLQADRADPESFFPALRQALEELARDGKYRVFFGKGLDYSKRRQEAAAAKRTVIDCPSSFLPTWDRLNVNVTTHPVEHDKSVVKQIAEALRKAGFKVAYVHGSYLHLRTTR
jgi:hypothetical protein